MSSDVLHTMNSHDSLYGVPLAEPFKWPEGCEKDEPEVKGKDEENENHLRAELLSESGPATTKTEKEHPENNSRPPNPDRASALRSVANPEEFRAGSGAVSEGKREVGGDGEVEKTQVSNTSVFSVPESPQIAESIAVEPLKSSKYGWLLRLRLNDVPGRPAIPITYKTDAEYRALRRSKRRYEQYKKSVKAEYQATIRKSYSDNASA